VAAALVISRSSLYYRKKPRGSRADRQWDEQIVLACGEKPAYGYRRVTWWLRRKAGLRDRLPAGSRENNLTLTTDNGTQFTSSRFMETLAQLGITHRRTASHHPEGNSYIERFHRSLKEEEVWTSDYRSLSEARENISRYLEEYNHDRPHRGVENRTPHEAFLAFAVLTKNQALTV
jgi:transposase InsO family protein